jgi:hypothetical protein
VYLAWWISVAVGLMVWNRPDQLFAMAATVETGAVRLARAIEHGGRFLACEMRLRALAKADAIDAYRRASAWHRARAKEA